MTDRYRHGGPYDRGMADAFYRRPFQPHFYKGDTYRSERVDLQDVDPDYKEYAAGFAANEQGEHKEW